MHQQEAAGAYCLDCVTPTTTAHQTGLGTDTWTTYRLSLNLGDTAAATDGRASVVSLV